MTTITDPKVGVTSRTVLLKAAEVVREKGHCADGALGPNGEVCVMAALSDATVALGVWPVARLHADATRAIQHTINGECPISWNYRQDAASVIDMLERAALSQR